MMSKPTLTGSRELRAAETPRALWLAGMFAIAASMLVRHLQLPSGYAKFCSASLLVILLCIAFVKQARRDWNLPGVVRSAAAVSVLLLVAIRYINGDRLIDHLWLGSLAAVLVSTHTVIGSVRAWSEFRTAGNDGHRWESALAHIIPAKLAALAMTELRMMRYAFTWTSRPKHPDASEAFSYHHNMVPMMLAFLALATVEAAVLHLLVSLWSKTATWILFAFSDFTVIYIVGLINSMRKLPLLVSNEGVQVNAGLLIGFWLPMPVVTGLYATPADQPIEKSRILKASLLSQPNVYIRLVEPTEVTGPFGQKRLVEAVGVHPDNLEGFSKSVTQARRAAFLGARPSTSAGEDQN